MFAFGKFCYPGLVFHVPVKGLFDALVKVHRRLPAQFAFNLPRVHGIPAVVGLAVFNKGNQILILAQKLQNVPSDLQIRVFVVPANIEHIAVFVARNNQIDRRTMIQHVQPVAHIQTIAIHRQRLVFRSQLEKEGDELLRKLVRPVVVGTAGNRDRHLVRLKIRLHQKVGGGLGSRVRTVRINGRLFRKIVLGTRAQVAVHLIRGDLVVALHLVIARGQQQVVRAHHVRLHKNMRINNAAVHVCLRREVDHRMELLPAKKTVDEALVGNIPAHERHPLGLDQLRDIIQIPRIRELIQHKHLILGMMLHIIMDVIAADKPGSACDEDFLGHKPKVTWKVSIL